MKTKRLPQLIYFFQFKKIFKSLQVDIKIKFVITMPSLATKNKEMLNFYIMTLLMHDNEVGSCVNIKGRGLSMRVTKSL